MFATGCSEIILMTIGFPPGGGLERNLESVFRKIPLNPIRGMQMTQEDAYNDRTCEQLQRKYNMLKDAVERFLKKQDGYKDLRKILKDLSDIP